MEKILTHGRKIIGYMLSWKALKYRMFTVTWTMICCLFWTGQWIESIEVTLSIVIGKFIYYGFHEWYEHDLKGRGVTL